MARWNGAGGGNSSDWNIRALASFLNKRADTQKKAMSAPSRLHARQAGKHSPLSLSFLCNDDEDVEMRQDSDVESTDSRRSTYSDIEEDQFLSKDERDRFFNVTLPKMQALALRLPELVKKPIPFLEQQEDSAVTLQQEQVPFPSCPVRLND